MLQQKIENRRKTAENVAFFAVLWYNFSIKRDMNESAQWRELLHKKDLEIEALHRQIDWLTQQLRRLNGRVYGRSSERSAELQEQELHRLGLPVSRQTMSNWVLTAGERWLLPVYHALHKELLANEILHADETTLMVLREPGRQARQRSYVWLYRTSGNALRPVVLYDYQPSRAGVCASRFLEGFSGYLHTDGYEAYHCSLPETVCSVGCWAHMRRKFTDTLRSLPKELRSRSPAQTGLDFCNRLFALEAEFLRQTLSAEQRYAQRKQRSEPIAGEFFRWAQNEYEKNPVPKSLYGAALGYALRQQSWLMNVFCDGRLELSNNRAERSVRPFATGRKNWLFSNTPLGAKISAVIYSLVETAKINGLNPASYLEYLLTALPCGSQPEDCLPWLPAAQTVCKA